MERVILWMKTVIVFTFPAITFIGLIINPISFIIFSRKRFKNATFSTYYRCFILFQTFSLILPINKMFELNFKIYFDSMSDLMCKLKYFYGYFNIANAAWFLVVISIDRFLSITYPVGFLCRKKKWFQFLTFCFIINFNITFLTPTWFYYIKKTSQTINDTNIINYCISHAVWVDFLELFHQVLIPFMLMILFTVSTASYVFKSRKLTNNTKTIKNDLKFTVLSISFNILFLLFNFPHFLLYMMKEYSHLFDEDSINLFELLQSFAYFLLYLNLISTFFINYFINSMFRKEIRIIFLNQSNF